MVVKKHFKIHYIFSVLFLFHEIHAVAQNETVKHRMNFIDIVYACLINHFCIQKPGLGAFS